MYADLRIRISSASNMQPASTGTLPHPTAFTMKPQQAPGYLQYANLRMYANMRTYADP